MYSVANFKRNFFQAFKSTYFWFIFNLKLNLNSITVLSSIITLKRCCKTVLNDVFISKTFMWKKFYLFGNFLCQIKILLLVI